MSLKYYPHADKSKLFKLDGYWYFRYNGVDHAVFDEGKMDPKAANILGPIDSWAVFRDKMPDADLSMFKKKGNDVVFEPSGAVLYHDGILNKKVMFDIVNYEPPRWPRAYLLGKRYATFPPVPFKETLKAVNFSEIPLNLSQAITLHTRNIFKNIDLKITNDADGHRWINGPDFSFWPQMLNLVVWCATTGCGVAMDMMDRGLAGSLFRFHVIITVRRLLTELNVPLPDDRAHNPRNLTYDRSALNRIMRRFNTSKDFRFTHGAIGGIGEVFATDGKRPTVQFAGEPDDQDLRYAAANKRWPNGNYQFNQEIQRLGFLYNPLSKNQWMHFIPEQGQGITTVGSGVINQSIEAFVYCILGAQVNTRSPIIGSMGASQETQQEFLTLFESAVKETDIGKNAQEYQNALQKANARLDYAISPGCRLMPSSLVLNTDTVVGYNNKLLTATQDMKFGINNVNLEKTQAVPHVDTPKTHIDKKPTPIPKPAPIPRKPEYDHTFLKAGIVVAGIGLGYYLI